MAVSVVRLGQRELPKAVEWLTPSRREGVDVGEDYAATRAATAVDISLTTVPHILKHSPHRQGDTRCAMKHEAC